MLTFNLLLINSLYIGIKQDRLLVSLIPVSSLCKTAWKMSHFDMIFDGLGRRSICKNLSKVNSFKFARGTKIISSFQSRISSLASSASFYFTFSISLKENSSKKKRELWFLPLIESTYFTLIEKTCWFQHEELIVSKRNSN